MVYVKTVYLLCCLNQPTHHHLWPPRWRRLSSGMTISRDDLSPENTALNISSTPRLVIDSTGGALVVDGGGPSRIIVDKQLCITICHGGASERPYPCKGTPLKQQPLQICPCVCPTLSINEYINSTCVWAACPHPSS